MLFISPQKLVLFSTYLSFCLDFLVMWQSGFVRKITLISNFKMSQPSYQIVVIHILSNISRSKGNETMQFGQLIECDMRNIFYEKLNTKCNKTSPRPFSEKLEFSISLNK